MQCKAGMSVIQAGTVT